MTNIIKNIFRLVLISLCCLGSVYASKEADQYYDIAQEALWKYRDDPKAFKYYQKLADMGDSRGYVGLGYLYSKSTRVGINYPKAIAYLEKAGAMGNAEGYFFLGEIYNTHSTWYDAPKDNSKAAQYYEKAGDMGSGEAYFLLGWMYRYEEVRADTSKIIECFQKAGDLGYSKGYLVLGSMYAYGMYVSTNYTKAAAYYQKAIDLGDPDGYSGLGDLYNQKQDTNKALEYYQKACKKGEDEVDCEEAEELKRQLSLKNK
ncbi:tetratricopeptide repeat protein [Helicobacter bizzozeronii]|uniref:tetratricopeptide repeat protein n=1 Tax=Helicobacter bizzozeronii TaxID=56877 RepID=UPI0018F81922|nr:tetratricopeptide repeat protein [Helicobacter bizzozeronii]